MDGVISKQSSSKSKPSLVGGLSTLPDAMTLEGGVNGPAVRWAGASSTALIVWLIALNHVQLLQYAPADSI